SRRRIPDCIAAGLRSQKFSGGRSHASTGERLAEPCRRPGFSSCGGLLQTSMNYCHVFHAGNFADVYKHTVLVRVLLHLRLKPTAFRVIDTHAGAGRYDLHGSEATRGGEWHQGIARIWRAREGRAVHDLIRPYLDVVEGLNPGGELRFYP